MIIAVDGPAGAGKGTISRAVAVHFSLKYIDTGLIYRAVAYKALSNNVILSDVESLSCLVHTITDDDLSSPVLRTENIGNAASKIAVLSSLRQQITDYIRSMTREVSSRYHGVILDGRDIGTVVCPDADIKIFITANADVRAARRLAEVGESAGQEYMAMATKINERDQRDQNRDISPLMPAENAIILDTSDFSIQQSCHHAIEIVLDYQNKSLQKAISQ